MEATSNEVSGNRDGKYFAQRTKGGGGRKIFAEHTLKNLQMPLG